MSEHTYLDKIQTDWVDLTRQRKAELIKPFTLLLYDTYFRFIGEFYAEQAPVDEQDNIIEYAPWEQQYILFDVSPRRANIAAVELYNEKDFFKVIISVTGLANDIRLFFKEYGKAKEVYRKLLAYSFLLTPKN